MPRSRSLSLETAARDYVWLHDARHGVPVEEIARQAGVSAEEVRSGIVRAEAVERYCEKIGREDLTRPDRSDLGFRLIPLFPIGPLTPQSTCPHHGPIPRGSRLICMVCHQSGMDDHPGLRRDP